MAGCSADGAARVLPHRPLRNYLATVNTVHPNSLHRLVKHAIDSGAAESVTEAEQMFHSYRLAMEFGSDAAEDPVEQTALLTAVAVGRRVFLGGVDVVGDLGTRLAVPLPLGRTLGDAVAALGGRNADVRRTAPTIVIGGEPAERRKGFCIRTIAAGWRGGIAPFYSDVIPAAGPPMPLAGMLAGALAVNEAYRFVTGDAMAGRQTVGLSLWDPCGDCDWVTPSCDEPKLTYLPSNLWLIGLGHLGQAYLWGLGILPYLEPGKVSLVLQDIDVITNSTESTSVLTDGNIGRRKTRLMAEWAERRGFATWIHERRFDANFLRQNADEPEVALCGVDNPEARRALDRVGFDLIVEVGLGHGHRDFRSMCLHTLPGPRPASEIWKHSASHDEDVVNRPAYRKLVSDEVLDRCGMTLLAGQAVGAPFVGAVAATLALSEILRPLHGGHAHQMIDLDLLSLDQRSVSRNPRDFYGWNPGFTLAGTD